MPCDTLGTPRPSPPCHEMHCPATTAEPEKRTSKLSAFPASRLQHQQVLHSLCSPKSLYSNQSLVCPTPYTWHIHGASTRSTVTANAETLRSSKLTACLLWRSSSCCGGQVCHKSGSASGSTLPPKVALSESVGSKRTARESSRMSGLKRLRGERQKEPRLLATAVCTWTRCPNCVKKRVKDNFSRLTGRRVCLLRKPNMSSLLSTWGFNATLPKLPCPIAEAVAPPIVGASRRSTSSPPSPEAAPR
mmetsp:Transcript_53910/g.174163  ORF Transcript_53910/g.174163 Transcript_53910/m.174163 type:complete len:247 (+) Transcript_53910:1836-2576(+)